MCEYCEKLNGSGRNWLVNDYLTTLYGDGICDIEIGISSDKELCVFAHRRNNAGDELDAELRVSISFCPMCGQELTYSWE